MIMHQNRVFATPSIPIPGKPNQPQPTSTNMGGVASGFGVRWARYDRPGVEFGYSKPRFHCTNIWVRELLPSRSEMVRFSARVKRARDKAGR